MPSRDGRGAAAPIGRLAGLTLLVRGWAAASDDLT
jgi:hypothetical protein